MAKIAGFFVTKNTVFQMTIDNPGNAKNPGDRRQLFWNKNLDLTHSCRKKWFIFTKLSTPLQS